MPSTFEIVNIIIIFAVLAAGIAGAVWLVRKLMK